MANALAMLKLAVSGAAEFNQTIASVKGRTVSSTSSMTKQVTKSLNAMAAQYLSTAVAIKKSFDIVNEGINFNKFVETSQMSFSVFMKSASAAQKKIQELYQFAANSPLTFTEVVSASKQLTAYGFAANQLQDNMTMLGSVAKATGQDLSDIAYIYGTLRSQGAAYSRDLLQFGMRGIPIYETLEKQLNLTAKQVKDLASTGELSFGMIEKAFKSMTSESGIYAGIMTKYMDTLEGKESQLKDLWAQATGSIASGVTDTLKIVVQELINTFSDGSLTAIFDTLSHTFSTIASDILAFAKVIAKLLPLITGLVDVLVTVAPAIIGITVALKIVNTLVTGNILAGFASLALKIGDFVAMLQLASSAILGFQLAALPTLGIFMAISAAIGGLVLILNKYKTAQQASIKEAEEMTQALQNQQEEIRLAQSGYEGLTQAIQNNLSAMQSRADFESGKTGTPLSIGGKSVYFDIPTNDWDSIIAWRKEVEATSEEYGVMGDRVLGILVSLGAISKEQASAIGLVNMRDPSKGTTYKSRESSKGYSTELGMTGEIFAKAALQAVDSSLLQKNGISQATELTDYGNAQRQFTFDFDSSKGIDEVSSALKDLAGISQMSADFVFGQMRGASGGITSNEGHVYSSDVTKSFNATDGNMVALMQVSDEIADMQNPENFKVLISQFEKLGISTDDLVTNVTDAYQSNIDTMVDLLASMPTSQLTDEENALKLYREAFIKQQQEALKAYETGADSVARKFYESVADYFDGWTVKITPTGVDDIQQELEQELAGMIASTNTKQVAVQNAQSSLQKANKGTDMVAIRNAQDELLQATVDLEKWTEYVNKSTPEIKQYYETLKNNQKYSESTEGTTGYSDELKAIAVGSLEAMKSSFASGKDNLKGGFSNGWESIKSGDFLEGLSTVWDGLKTGIGDYLGAEDIKAGFKTGWADMKTGFSSGNLSGMLDGIKDGVDSMAGGFSESGIGAGVKATGTAFKEQLTTGTELGSTLGGADPLMQLVAALATVVSGIDNVTEVLNPFTTIAEAAMDFFDNNLTTVLEPFVDVLEEFGSVLGGVLSSVVAIGAIIASPLLVAIKILEAALQIVGNVLTWVSDSIIIPIANGVIDIVNIIIGVLNMIPGVSLDYIDALDSSTDALEDWEEALDNASSNLDSTVSYLEDAINDMVDDELSSLQDLYEAGAYTGEEYESAADTLNDLAIDDDVVSDSDTALGELDLTDLDNYAEVLERLAELYEAQSFLDSDDADDYTDESLAEMLEGLGISTTSSTDAKLDEATTILEAIEDYTSSTADWLSYLTYLEDDSSDSYDSDATFGDYVGDAVDWVVDGVTDVVDDIIDGVTDVVDWVSGLFGFATGTTDVPYDMTANIHKGETIVPATFSEGIRNGDMSLVGSGSTSSSSSGDTYAVSITVKGSVTSEDDLASTISEKLYTMNKRGTRTA